MSYLSALFYIFDILGLGYHCVRRSSQMMNCSRFANLNTLIKIPAWLNLEAQRVVGAAASWNETTFDDHRPLAEQYDNIAKSCGTGDIDSHKKTRKNMH